MGGTVGLGLVGVGNVVGLVVGVGNGVGFSNVGVAMRPVAVGSAGSLVGSDVGVGKVVGLVVGVSVDLAASGEAAG